MWSAPIRNASPRPRGFFCSAYDRLRRHQGSSELPSDGAGTGAVGQSVGASSFFFSFLNSGLFTSCHARLRISSRTSAGTRVLTMLAL